MRQDTRFRGDERGIEGLPVRLVIALVVGVASLSLKGIRCGNPGFSRERTVDSGLVNIDGKSNPQRTDTIK